MKLQLIPGPLWPETALQTTAPVTLAALHQLEVFWVERAKTARQWLKEWAHPKPIQSLEIIEFERESPERWQSMLQEYQQQNRSIGLLSEAGCPAVADPGASVVRLAHRLNIPVEALPGSSSITLALMSSGFNGQRFCFRGYVPVALEEKRKHLGEHLRHAWQQHATQIYIETPYRAANLIEHLILLGKEWARQPWPHDANAAKPTAERRTAAHAIQLHLAVASALTSTEARVQSKPLSQWRNDEAASFNDHPAIFMLAYI